MKPSCRALEHGDWALALAGGPNNNSSPNKGVDLARAGFF